MIIYYILSAVLGALVALAWVYHGQIAFAVEHKDQISKTASAVDSVKSAVESFGIKF